MVYLGTSSGRPAR
uniref:Uncharacterized protein n=1 Tax=Arundo donax TaxID=35708 RepID=A0A0A9ABP9_ARUDO